MVGRRAGRLVPWGGPGTEGATFPTLGVQVGQWIERNAGLTLDVDQRHDLAHMYRLDETGRRRWRNVLLAESKGKGKSTLAAAIALAELVGPVRFAGWRANGEPAGVPLAKLPAPATQVPWIRVMAQSENQAYSNTFRVLAEMAEQLRDSAEPDLPPLRIGYAAATARRITGPRGAVAEVIPASANSAEGGRESFVILEEAHLSIGPHAHALFRTVNRNLRKKRDAWMLLPTNAWYDGEGSVAEALAREAAAVQRGESRSKELLFLHRMGHVTDLSDTPALIAGLREAYGAAAERMDLEAIADLALSDAIDPPEFRRFYLSEPTTKATAWLAAREWDACGADVVLQPGDPIALGFDGSLSGDCTAIVAVRLKDSAAFLLNLWNPRVDGGPIPADEVSAAMATAHARFDVRQMLADVAFWEGPIDRWTTEYGGRYVKAPAFDMRVQKADTVRATEALHTAIIRGELRHDRNGALREHALNATRRPTRWGVTIRKETHDSSRKIDAAAALILAWHAARMARGDTEPEYAYYLGD